MDDRNTVNVHNNSIKTQLLKHEQASDVHYSRLPALKHINIKTRYYTIKQGLANLPCKSDSGFLRLNTLINVHSSHINIHLPKFM